MSDRPFTQTVVGGIFIIVVGGLILWLIEEGSKARLHPVGSNQARSTTEVPPPKLTKTATPAAPGPRPASLPKPKPHETRAPLAIQIGDFVMAMKQCIWTEKSPPWHAICEGTMENKSGTKLAMKFDSGLVIDDKGNEYALSNSTFLLGFPGIMFLGAGGSLQEMMPNLPLKFGFAMMTISRDATAVNFVLKFSTSGSPTDSEVLFRDIPIRQQ